MITLQVANVIQLPRSSTVVKTKALLWNNFRVFVFTGFAALVLRAYLS